MTTHYPVRCPILLRCLRQLRKMNDGPVYENEREQLDLLMQRFPMASGQHDYVCLRGFLAIERMLKLMETLYVREKIPPEDPRRHLKVAARSWGELTENKQQLTLLFDQINLTVSEAKLGGSRFDKDRLVLGGQHLQDAFNTDAGAAIRTDTAARLRPIVERITHSIVAFRPYLRNPEIFVGSLGDDLAFITQQIYGSVALPSFLEITRQLMDTQL